MADSSRISSLPRFRAALLHPRYWLQWLLLGLFFLLSMMPMVVIDTVAAWLAALLHRHNRKRVGYARSNLALCFPDTPAAELDALVKQHFLSYTRSLLHYGLIWWAPTARLRRLIDFDHDGLIEQAQARGENLIALTSHSVGLEFSVLGLSLHHACSGSYKPMKNALIDWLVARGRSRFGVRAWSRGDGFRPLIKDARAGRVLIYLGDEDLGADNSVFAPFFGVPKATLPVLARLAKQCRARVLACTSCYDPKKRQYRVILLDNLEGIEDCDAQASAERMNRAIEQTVEQCVAQYFWTLRLFKTRPEGEAPVYARR